MVNPNPEIIAYQPPIHEIPGLIRSMLMVDRNNLKEQLANSNNVNLSPRYLISNSTGNHTIEVVPVYFDTQKSHFRSRQYYFYGFEKELGFVARRSMRIDFAPHATTTSGRLDTAFKNHGFGTAMELVNINVLQNEANQNGPINWVIVDENRFNVMTESSEERLWGEDDSVDSLPDAVAEHQRWQQIYSRFPGKELVESNLHKKIVTLNPDLSYPSPSPLIKAYVMERQGLFAQVVRQIMYESEADKISQNAAKLNEIITFLETKF